MMLTIVVTLLFHQLIHKKKIFINVYKKIWNNSNFKMKSIEINSETTFTIVRPLL